MARNDFSINHCEHFSYKRRSLVDQTVVRIEDVSTNANQSGMALKDIVGIVVQTSDQISAIAVASEEQSASSEEINISISHINELSGKTSTIMGEAACAVIGKPGISTYVPWSVSPMRKQMRHTLPVFRWCYNVAARIACIGRWLY